MTVTSDCDIQIHKRYFILGISNLPLQSKPMQSPKPIDELKVQPLTTQPRSIDDYFEESYEKSSTAGRLHYWLLFISLGMANAGDSTEMTSMSFILADDDFKSTMLEGDLAGKGSLLASTIFAGMLVGGVLTGAYGDGLGRRPMLLFGLFLNTLSGFSAAMAPNFSTICICRFGSGVGIGAILASLVALATEISPPSKRGLFVTFVCSFWTVGTIYTAVIALLQLGIYKISWRIFLATCALPCLLGFISVYCMVPESARYFAIRGDYEQAVLSANRLCRTMGYRGSSLQSSEVSYFFENKQKDEKIVVKNFREMSREALQRFKDIYRPELRSRTLTLQLIWCLLSSGTALCTWINTIFSSLHVSNVYVHALIFASANIPGNITSGLILDRVNRKTFASFTMLCSSFSLFFFAYSSTKSDTNQNMILFSSCLFHAFLVCNWCAVNVLTSEQFPTEVRGMGMGICAATGRISSMVMQYAYGSMVKKPTLMIMTSSLFFLFAALTPMLIKKDMTGKALKDQLGDTRHSKNKRFSKFDVFELIKSDDV